MENETKQIKDELYRMTWYMRGGVTISEAYAMSNEDRRIVAKIINDNIEMSKKAKMPLL